MAAYVRPYVPILDLGDITTGAAVRGRTWSDAAAISNYLRGHGNNLIPMTGGLITIASGSTYTFRYRVRTSATSLCRIWAIQCYSFTGQLAQLEVKSPALTGPAQTFNMPSVYDNQTLVAEYVEYYTGGGAEEEATISVKNNSPHTATIMGLSLRESPRSRLELDALDLGVDETTAAAREPILLLDNNGLAGVSEILTDSSNGTRSGIFHWATDITVPFTNSSTSFVGSNLFDLSAIPVLGRRLSSATATTSNIAWRVYAKTSDTTYVGQVRVTNLHGSDVITIPAASHTGWAWFPPVAGAPNTFPIDCEDAASTDGRQTSGTPAWDEMDIDCRRTAGAGTLSIAAVSFFEL